MRIQKLSGYENRYCENCGRFKTHKKIEDEHLTRTIWGVYIGSGESPDYMLCNTCLNELFDCVKNARLCNVDLDLPDDKF